MFEIHSQPGSGFFGKRLIAELERGAYKHYNRLLILVAYARTSGVLRLKPALDNFIAAGGKVEVSIGVGQGNTSYEALAELLKLDLSLTVYHDKNLAQTFHPKVYLLSRAGQHAWVSVGSSNLTAGGHYSNYEINVLASFDLTKQGDVQLVKDLKAATEDYVDPGHACCRKVTTKVLNQLRDDGFVISEIGAKLSFMAKAKKSAKQTLFGTVPLPAAIPIAIANTKAAIVIQKAPPAAAAPAPVPAAVQMPANPDLFWKRLSNYDASKTSSPGQIQIPIGYKPKFPPLSSPKLTPKGAMQSETHFDVLFQEVGKAAVAVPNARAILYEPAPGHKRKNVELRFTFLNRAISSKLKKDDVLIFRRTAGSNTWFAVELVRKANAGAYVKKHDTVIP